MLSRNKINTRNALTTGLMGASFWAGPTELSDPAGGGKLALGVIGPATIEEDRWRPDVDQPNDGVFSDAGCDASRS